jgi:lambda family phage portal protein
MTPRVGQSRGVTVFAPVMYNLRMLQGYQEAEVVAARIGASKLGFIATEADAYGGEPEGSQDTAQTIDTEPGSFGNLLPGQSVETWDPKHPTEQYRDFVKGMVQSVAAGMGLSYASLSGDLEGTSYASGRTGLLQERDHYRADQAWLIEHLCRRVFTAWLDWATLKGVLSLDETKRRAVEAAVLWQPRGWSWVDPKNDVEASILAIEHGLENRQSLLAGQGRDFEDVAQGLQQEEAIAASLGVEIAPAPPPAPAAKADEGDDEADGEKQAKKSRKRRAA